MKKTFFHLCPLSFLNTVLHNVIATLLQEGQAKLTPTKERCKNVLRIYLELYQWKDKMMTY